ncbi:Rhodanese-like domain containing protein [Aphelenchoides avenae]|nr:Rhodanese-like domain containing protein [Aphelenchus avenae]
MDFEDVTTNSPNNTLTDRSPDSGVSMDSMDSAPAEAPTGFAALPKEPPTKDKFGESAVLDKMEVSHVGEQPPAEQFKEPRHVLKAPRGTQRKPRINIQIPDDMDVDDTPKDKTEWRRPDTPHPRKRLMDMDGSMVEADWSKRFRHTDVSIDTSPESEAAFSTPAPVATPPQNNVIQLSSSLLRAPSRKMPAGGEQSFSFISGASLALRLSTLSQEEFLAKYVLVDCRFPYEYAGGHIKYSINIHKTEELADVFFPSNEQLLMKIKCRTPIFYSELSETRGLAMAKELSRIGRGRHERSRLDYSTVYVVRHGYKAFFESGFTEHCHPQGYVNMRHPFHHGELKKYNIDKENYGSFCDAEQTPSTSGLQQSKASSSLLVLGHSAINVVQDSPMLSDDFARARIASSPITPRVKRPAKGEGRRLRFFGKL